MNTQVSVSSVYQSEKSSDTDISIISQIELESNSKANQSPRALEESLRAAHSGYQTLGG